MIIIISLISIHIIIIGIVDFFATGLHTKYKKYKIHIFNGLNIISIIIKYLINTSKLANLFIDK